MFQKIAYTSFLILTCLGSQTIQSSYYTNDNSSNYTKVAVHPGQQNNNRLQHLCNITGVNYYPKQLGGGLSVDQTTTLKELKGNVAEYLNRTLFYKKNVKEILQGFKSDFSNIFSNNQPTKQKTNLVTKESIELYYIYGEENKEKTLEYYLIKNHHQSIKDVTNKTKGKLYWGIKEHITLKPYRKDEKTILDRFKINKVPLVTVPVDYTFDKASAQIASQCGVPEFAALVRYHGVKKNNEVVSLQYIFSDYQSITLQQAMRSHSVSSLTWTLISSIGGSLTNYTRLLSKQTV